MSVLETIVERVEDLPIERQREVLDFAEFLQHKEKSNGKGPAKKIKGMWEGVNITREDIDEIRQEMWGNFPREDI